MYVDCLQRHLAVCAMRDLPRFARYDPRFWNLVSMLGPEAPNPQKIGFREQHRAFLNDVRAEATGADAELRIVDKNTMGGILKFVDDRPGQPMLIHCVAGVSRSPAAALVLVLRSLLAVGAQDPASVAIEALLQIRPQARPNPLVVQAGLACFLSESKASQLLARIMAEPRMTGEKHREGSEEE